MKEVVLNIEGMHCEGCVNRINNVVSNVKGVNSFNVSLEEKNITVSVKNDKVVNEVKKSIEKLGFNIID